MQALRLGVGPRGRRDRRGDVRGPRRPVDDRVQLHPAASRSIEETDWVLSHFRPEPDLVEATRTAATLFAVTTFMIQGPRAVRSLVVLRRLPPAPPDTLLGAIETVLLAGRPGPGHASLPELCDSDEPLVAGIAAVVTSYVAENADDLDGALKAARRMLDGLENRATPWVRVLAHARIGELCLQLERGEEAQRHLTAALSVLEELGPWPDAIGDPVDAGARQPAARRRRRGGAVAGGGVAQEARSATSTAVLSCPARRPRGDPAGARGRRGRPAAVAARGRSAERCRRHGRTGSRPPVWTRGRWRCRPSPWSRTPSTAGSTSSRRSSTTCRATLSTMLTSPRRPPAAVLHGAAGLRRAPAGAGAWRTSTAVGAPATGR